mmetsp:Transcript_20432/g.47504  ORF Transcript_20432/g.47504 Transcript_20432/m.47504 type:complete len:211 (+) Transcript_20432:2266-2898(+)
MSRTAGAVVREASKCFCPSLRPSLPDSLAGQQLPLPAIAPVRARGCVLQLRLGVLCPEVRAQDGQARNPALCHLIPDREVSLSRPVDSVVERHAAFEIARERAGAGAEEHRGEVRPVGGHGPVEGRSAIGGHVWVSALDEQLEHALWCELDALDLLFGHAVDAQCGISSERGGLDLRRAHRALEHHARRGHRGQVGPGHGHDLHLRRGRG